MHRLTRFALTVPLVAALALAASGGAPSRGQVRVIGSSTVFPYSQAVAEEFSGETDFASPIVEATGTGGGLRLFCAGVGPRTPDVTASSRRIAPSELEQCRRNGVTDLTEARFGKDAVIVALSRRATLSGFSRADLFRALAASVEIDGKIVPNPYRRWNEIDPALPDEPIRAFGPPMTSGTRDAFTDLILGPGCRSFPDIAALPEARRTDVCGRIRQDGVFVATGETDNLIARRLTAETGAIGIFGFSALFENADRLRGASIDGVEPTRANIVSGTYGAIRPLYLYIKNAHRGVVPGLDEFLNEYVSEAAIGPDGYLVERGLVPAEAADRHALQALVAAAGTPGRS